MQYSGIVETQTLIQVFWGVTLFCWVVPDVSKGLYLQGWWSRWTTHPATQRHISGDPNPQQEPSENLRPLSTRAYILSTRTKKQITADSEMCKNPVKWILLPWNGASSNFSSNLSEIRCHRYLGMAYPSVLFKLSRAEHCRADGGGGRYAATVWSAGRRALCYNETSCSNVHSVSGFCHKLHTLPQCVCRSPQPSPTNICWCVK